MAALLITYDLNRPGQEYDEFYEVIKSYTWVRLSESSYGVDTTDTPAQVYDKLSPHLDENDRVYVITLKKPWRGFGLEEVNDWLEERL